MGRNVGGTCTADGLYCLQGTRSSRMALGGWIVAILQINRVWREDNEIRLSARNWNVYQARRMDSAAQPRQRWVGVVGTSEIGTLQHGPVCWTGLHGA